MPTISGVGICGEMAGDPILTPLLLGLGIDEVSMSPFMIPEIKKIIRSMTYREAQEIARHVLTFETGTEVLNFLRQKYHQVIKYSVSHR